MKKMRKWDFRNRRIMRWTSIHPSQLNERFVLLNLLATQSLVLVLAVIFILLQKNNAWSDMFSLEAGWVIWPIGILFAAVVLLVNAVVDKMAPPEVTDDGGLNRLLFGRRPLWQILLLWKNPILQLINQTPANRQKRKRVLQRQYRRPPLPRKPKNFVRPRKMVSPIP